MKIYKNKKVVSLITNDKEANADYWKIIDDCVETCVKSIASCSTSEVSQENLNEIISKVASNTKNNIITDLEKAGCIFPVAA